MQYNKYLKRKIHKVLGYWDLVISNTSPDKVFDDQRQNIYRALSSLIEKGII